MNKMKRRILEGIIGMGLNKLSECSTTLESLIEKEKDDLTEWIDKQGEKLSKKEKEEIPDWFIDNYSKIAEVMPNIVRSSLFVSYYSFLESTLLTICLYLKHENNCKLDPDDLRDTGIFKAQTYLKKVAGIQFPDSTSSWNEIIFYNRIRNHIVHDQGRVPDASVEKIKPFVRRKAWLMLDSKNRISFPKDFSAEVTKTLGDFFSEVIETLP